MGWATADDEKEKLAVEMLQVENENVDLRARLNKVSDELLNAKTNLGAVMNSIFEFGGSDLFDKIEEKMTFGEH